jgi:hypothetical protein
MMSMRNVALALVGDGCASFRAGPGVPVSMGPATTGSARTISVAVTGTERLGGQDLKKTNTRLDVCSTAPTADPLRCWRDFTLQAYREAGVFASVSPGLGASDLRAEVRILRRADPNTDTALFVTGIFMGIVPMKVTDEYVVTTTIRDAGGNVLGTFEKSEAVDTWMQLFMLFAMPGHTFESVMKSVLIDLNQATIAEARAQGIL